MNECREHVHSEQIKEKKGRKKGNENMNSSDESMYLQTAKMK